MANTKPLASQIKYGNGTTVSNALSKSVLSYQDYAAASAAAATLPDWQVVDVEGTLTRYDVLAGDLTNARPITPFTAVGGVRRSAQSKASDIVSVKDYGAIGDGLYHPLSERFSTLAMAQVAYPHVTNLSQSIDWAAIQMTINTAGAAWVPQSRYVLTDDVNVWRGCRLFGDGADRWDTVFQSGGDWNKEDSRGTHLYFYGTGPKKYSLDRVSACRTSGGARNINGLEYELLDFTSGDAVAGSTSTPKLFSAGIVVHQGAQVQRLRAVPWFDGINGYNNRETTDLSDAWDIGIYPLSAWDILIEDVQSVGHWRMAGALAHSAKDSEAYPNGERSRYVRCLLQGLRGASIRGGDLIKVISNTANTLTVPWDKSFVWGGGRSFIANGSAGSVSVTPSAESYDPVTSTVTFTSNVTLTGTLYELRPYASNGLSFTDFEDCFVTGLEHASGQRADQLGLGVSSPIECSGFGVRQPMARGTKFQTHEAAAGIFHTCTDVRLTDCQFEGRDSATTYLLATPFDSGSLIVTPHQRGHTDGMRMVGTTVSASVNMSEFKPRGCWWDIGAIPSASANSNDNQQIFKNWRSGPFRLQDDMGRNFVELPAGDAPQLDLDLNRDGASYRLRATSSDVILQAKTGKNFLIVDGSGAVNIKVFQSGRTEFRNSPVSSVDNTASLGTATNRWSVVYAGTGTINTSDAREKTSPLQIDDAVLDAWGDVQLITFQWLESVMKKGDDSRWHFGVIAQQVRDAFEARGLDGTRYGLLCYDEWGDEYAPVMAMRDVERQVIEVIGLDDDGTPIEKITKIIEQEEYDTGEVRLVRAAGNRWGIRADQCLFLEAAYQRRERARDREEFAQFKQEVLQRLSQLGGGSMEMA